MKHLSELLERLNDAETTHTKSKSSLDGSMAFILSKDELKKSRFEFNELSAELAKELLGNEEFLKEASRFINVEEY